MPQITQLSLTVEQLRVLNLALDKIKRPELAEDVYGGYADDVTVINGVAGQVRGLYEQVKRSTSDEVLWTSFSRLSTRA